MKIVQVHNYYQIKGGEDTVVAAEKALLEANGHVVIPYYKTNHEIADYSLLKKVKLIHDTTWSQATYDDFFAFLKEHQPDLVHVHNFLPLISPSVFYACNKAQIPVVQTLHNYRLICTNGIFQRDGKICEDCLGKKAKGAIAKKCYRNSKTQTYAVARMLDKHTAKGTWNEKIDAYICLTDFARDKFIQHGLPAKRLFVKPNFIAEQIHTPAENSTNYFLFVGRLTRSKGVELLKAVASNSPFPIKLVGEGDLAESLNNIPNLELLGTRSNEETLSLIKHAKALILPSRWYEGMPMTILEAFSQKTPVITSKLGAMKSMIQHNENGILIDPFSKIELLDALTTIASDPTFAQKLAVNAYADYLSFYSPEANYQQLMKIYKGVCEL